MDEISLQHAGQRGSGQATPITADDAATHPQSSHFFPACYDARVSKDRTKRRRRRGSGGGTLSGFRRGMKSLVGGGPQKPESTFSRVLTYLLLGALVAVVIYRVSQCVR